MLRVQCPRIARRRPGERGGAVVTELTRLRAFAARVEAAVDGYDADADLYGSDALEEISDALGELLAIETEET